MASTHGLATEMDAYDRRCSELESDHHLKWVVFHADKFLGAYDSLEDAAHHAHIKVGEDPYLIKQVGVPPLELPPVLRMAMNRRGRS